VLKAAWDAIGLGVRSRHIAVRNVLYAGARFVTTLHLATTVRLDQACVQVGYVDVDTCVRRSLDVAVRLLSV